MTRAEIQAIVDRFQDAYTRRDVDAMTNLYAENGVVDSLVAGTVQGRAAIGDVYRVWFAAFPDVAVTTDSLVIDGDRAVLVQTHAGTNRGGFMGLPPSNRPFRVAIVRVYTFKDGYIAQERRIYDFTGLLLQIGVLKARPA